MDDNSKIPSVITRETACGNRNNHKLQYMQCMNRRNTHIYTVAIYATLVFYNFQGFKGLLKSRTRGLPIHLYCC